MTLPLSISMSFPHLDLPCHPLARFLRHSPARLTLSFPRSISMSLPHLDLPCHFRGRFRCHSRVLTYHVIPWPDQGISSPFSAHYTNTVHSPRKLLNTPANLYFVKSVPKYFCEMASSSPLCFNSSKALSISARRALVSSPLRIGIATLLVFSVIAATLKGFSG